ncbi:probable endochitinase [Eupeodes corollae]|uniref:probable endochitinase n=1 Tax=Eupeodes corollae TaxID=290404 RepID=UPI0024926AA0|nr:probable endochitinase [Eupeodes corollae]
MKTIVKILVFCAAICVANSLCNTCSALTNLACVANDKVSVCVNGLPTTSVIPCPTGTVCTPTVAICSAAGTVPASCSRCGTCDANKAFACTGYNTFALCYGTTTPSAINFSCSGTLVCNIDDPRICVDPTTTGLGGTCPSASATTTTPTTTAAPTTTTVSPGVNPQAYCAGVGLVGRYEIATDPNCKRYVYCSLLNNSTWVGNIYECPGSTYFNSASRLCGVTVPARCAV